MDKFDSKYDNQNSSIYKYMLVQKFTLLKNFKIKDVGQVISIYFLFSCFTPFIHFIVVESTSWFRSL